MSSGKGLTHVDGNVADASRPSAQELLRQPHLLKDLQSSQNGSSAISNPFALLRQHAQNSQGLTAPNAARSAKSGRDADVKMD